MVSIGPHPHPHPHSSLDTSPASPQFDLGKSVTGRNTQLAFVPSETGPTPNLFHGAFQLLRFGVEGIGRLAGYVLGVGSQLLDQLLSNPTADTRELVRVIRDLEAQGLDIDSAIALQQLPSGDLGVYALRDPDDPFPELLAVIKQDSSIVMQAGRDDGSSNGPVGPNSPMEWNPGDLPDMPQYEYPNDDRGSWQPGDLQFDEMPGMPEMAARREYPEQPQREFRERWNAWKPPIFNSSEDQKTPTPGLSLDPNSFSGGSFDGTGAPELPVPSTRPAAGSTRNEDAAERLREGRDTLRELEEASRRTGRPLEELVRERGEELRAAGQGDLALELEQAFAHAYPNIAGPTGGRANAPVESSAEINRIRQTDPQELAGEINGANDLARYHEEELKAIMQRLLGAQSASEDITAALERIGRAAPQVANAMAQERFSTEAAQIFEMMNLAEISQRIDEKLIAILRDPQSAIESFTPDDSAAVQRLMSQHYPELQSPEDIARFLIQMFVNPVSGLKNANALPLVAQEGHHLIVAEFGGGKSVNETLSHQHGNDFIAAGMAEIARVVTEAGGQVLHPNGATAALVLPPDNVEATLKRLDEVFRDFAIGTGDIGPGGEVFKPGIAWFDTGAITDTSIQALEEQFARGRREIDDVKAGRVEEGLYPARGSDVFEPYNPEIHSNVRPLEGTADVPPTGARNAQNEPIRREYDAALEAIRAMPKNEQDLLTERLIEERFTHATGILNGAASLEAPRDADGRVPAGYVHAQGDMSRLSVINNQLGWDVGDAAIGHLNAALEAAAAAYPDVTFQKYGGDEWEAIGPRESAEAAVAMIRQYLADVTISFPNPNNPAETWTLHGLGVQIGILDIERDSRTGRAPSDELEHTMGEDKARRGYRLDIRDEQGRPVQP